ncbi:MAG: acetyl-CoA acetyltransferase [Deltaproteobacteria bacterium]
MTVYVLGGFQTDFAFNWSKHDEDLWAIFGATVNGAFEATNIVPKDVDVAHVANFSSELFCGQNQLGGWFASAHPDLAGTPASRHEAACASGSVAMLAASAEIEAGRYDLACVLGVEQMRNVPGQEAAKHLGVCAWNGREGEGATYLWPHMFSRLADVYAERHGLDREHLVHLAKKNFANARKNENAQTRRWSLDDDSFGVDDQANPVIEGNVRRHDCSQITDGGAAVFLASERYAKRYAETRGVERLAKLAGFGHRTAPMLLDDKLAASAGQPYVFGEVKRTIDDALRRAALPDAWALDAVECHDCFSISEYMAIDHFGLCDAGQPHQAIERGDVDPGGRLPFNPSGGLIGGGHPIGATGVRMVLDAFRQVTDQAGDYQVDGAKRVATLNIGGSTTTSVSFVVERATV